MVDGVLASCYAECSPDLAHLGITYWQRFSVVMEWSYGNNPGFLSYVASAKQLGNLILPDGQYLNY